MLAACARRNSRQLGPDRPSADSHARAATPTAGPQPRAVAVRAVWKADATPGARAPHASETASAASPQASRTTIAAGDRRRPPAGLDQLRQASAAAPGVGGCRARGATPAARCLLRAGRGGYEPAHRARPEERGRGRRRPCRRSSQSSPDGEVTPILAPFTYGAVVAAHRLTREDRKSTRLNSSHVAISYAVFC